LCYVDTRHRGKGFLLCEGPSHHLVDSVGCSSSLPQTPSSLTFLKQTRSANPDMHFLGGFANPMPITPLSHVHRNQHFIKMNATSAVSWAVAWSAFPKDSLQFNGNAFINASEPWSGTYGLALYGDHSLFFHTLPPNSIQQQFLVTTYRPSQQ
jgi:hypothetical protein